MLLMDDEYDPDDVLMDVDAINDFEVSSGDEVEIDFENPSFIKSTFDEFASETERITELFN